MGTFFTALLLALLAVAVYFAGRAIRRRKGCGGRPLRWVQRVLQPAFPM